MPEVIDYVAMREAQKAKREVEAAQAAGTQITTPAVEIPATPSEAEQLVETPVESEATEQEATSEKSEETPESTEPEPVKKKTHGLEKRIAKLVKERETALQEAAFYRGQLTTGTTQPQIPKTLTPADTSLLPGPPNPANYTDQIEYQLDVREYQREQARLDREFKTKINQAKAKYPDLQELIELDSTDVVRPDTMQLLKESDATGDLFYFFMSHPDEFNAINAMSPLRKAKEFGKIETRIAEKSTSKPAKKVSNAPKPITPVKQSSSVKPGTDTRTKYELY